MASVAVVGRSVGDGLEVPIIKGALEWKHHGTVSKENLPVFVQGCHISMCPKLSNREDSITSIMVYRATLLTSLEKVSSMRNPRTQMEFL